MVKPSKPKHDNATHNPGPIKKSDHTIVSDKTYYKKPKQELKGYVPQKQKKNKFFLTTKEFWGLERNNEGDIPLEILIRYQKRITDNQFAQLTTKNIKELVRFQLTGQGIQSKTKRGGFSKTGSIGKDRRPKRFGRD